MHHEHTRYATHLHHPFYESEVIRNLPAPHKGAGVLLTCKEGYTSNERENAEGNSRRRVNTEIAESEECEKDAARYFVDHIPTVA